MQKNTQGNALIFVLIMGLVLLMSVSLVLAVTRSNVQTADERTARAQVNLDAQINGPQLVRKTVAAISAASRNGTNPRSEMDALNNCADGSYRVFTSPVQSNCTSIPGNSDPIDLKDPSDPRREFQSDGAFIYPFRVAYRANVAENRKQVYSIRGSFRQVMSYAVVADTVTFPDEARVYDGAVYITSAPQLPAQDKLIFNQGLISASQEVKIGSQSVSMEQFKPNPAFPCAQDSADCPRFSEGLAMYQKSRGTSPAQQAINQFANVPNSSSVVLPSGIREVVLGSEGSSTLLFACNTTCTAYKFLGDGTQNLERYSMAVPVPEKDGGVYQWPDGTWQSAGRGRNIKSTDNLLLRALQPNSASYTQRLSLYSSGNITIGSSLRALNPVCDSYPVSDESGNIIPARCQQSPTNEELTVASGANLYIGDSTRPLASGESNTTIHAHLLAGNQLRVADTRLAETFVVGSLMAKDIDLSGIQLTYDRRHRNDDWAVAVRHYLTQLDSPTIKE